MFALAGLLVRTTLEDSLIDGYIFLSNLLSSLVRKIAFVFGCILHLCTCGIFTASHSRRLSYFNRRYNRQEFLCTRSCRRRRIGLPPLVLVRIGIVADASDNKTRKAIHQPRCFHLETKNTAKLRAYPVSGYPILYNLVTGSYGTIVTVTLRTARATALSLLHRSHFGPSM